MTTTTLDALLTQADDAARLGDWQASFEALAQAAEVEVDDAGLLTGLGACLVQMGQLDLALPYFERAVQLEPGSAEVFNNLGFVRAQNGQLEAAQAAYQMAVELDGNHLQAWKNLAAVHLQQGHMMEGVQILASVVQAYPQDADALWLMGQCYEEAGDVASARNLAQEVLKHQPDHAGALALLERLPKTVDLTRIARPEHAANLKALKGLKTLKGSAVSMTESAQPRQAAEMLKVIFYGNGEVSDGVRLVVPAKGMLQHGGLARVSPTLDLADLDQFDVFVFSRPHLSAQKLSLLDACVQRGKRVIIDLDDDFHHLPEDHPDYHTLGPGNPAILRNLEWAIGQAELLTVATSVLAERYGTFARRVEVIPNGWSRENHLWDKPSPRRSTINIGWAGTATHRQDLVLLKLDLTRLLRELPGTQLVIGGDYAVYESFGSLSEERRIFLPMASFDDYPFTLAHFDILLAPLRDNPFNQAKSDIKLLEAGIRRIPWVASPVPSYQEWAVGGFFARKPGDWFNALKKLVEDAGLRQELGEAGRQKAEERESLKISERWAGILADSPS